MRHGLMVPRDGDPATTPVHVLVWGLMRCLVRLDDDGMYQIIDTLDRSETWPYAT